MSLDSNTQTKKQNDSKRKEKRAVKSVGGWRIIVTWNITGTELYADLFDL
jgi:hypothetical protein